MGPAEPERRSLPVGEGGGIADRPRPANPSVFGPQLGTDDLTALPLLAKALAFMRCCGMVKSMSRTEDDDDSARPGRPGRLDTLPRELRAVRNASGDDVDATGCSLLPCGALCRLGD